MQYFGQFVSCILFVSLMSIKFDYRFNLPVSIQYNMLNDIKIIQQHEKFVTAEMRATATNDLSE